MSARIHPTAVVDASAELGDGVEVGAGAYVGPGCVIGDGTRLLPRAVVLRDVVMGPENVVHSCAVIGGDPQDFKYTPDQKATAEVGARCLFFEGATVNRGVVEHGPTRVGDGCMLMTGAHLGHNARLGDRAVLANGASLGGHAVVGEGAFLSAYACVHQFVEVGEFVMAQGYAGASQHAPPFVMIASGANTGVAGLNRVGLRRSGRFSAEDQKQIRAVFRLVYRGRDGAGWSLDGALERADGVATEPGAKRFVAFVRAARGYEAPRAKGLMRPARRWGDEEE